MASINLVACRDQDSSFAVDQQARVTCSESCTRHGQCGTLPDNQKAILAGVNGPAVSLHDRFFIEGTEVIVVEISERELIAAQNGVPLIPQATPFPHTFYRVSAADRTAWVSEWCLARP